MSGFVLRLRRQRRHATGVAAVRIVDAAGRVPDRRVWWWWCTCGAESATIEADRLTVEDGAVVHETAARLVGAR